MTTNKQLEFVLGNAMDRIKKLEKDLQAAEVSIQLLGDITSNFLIEQSKRKSLLIRLFSWF
jgi:hypothetical protein